MDGWRSVDRSKCDDVIEVSEWERFGFDVEIGPNLDLGEIVIGSLEFSDLSCGESSATLLSVFCLFGLEPV